MKILKPHEVGRGLMVEYDAGYVSPNHNKEFINEVKKIGSDNFDFQNPYVYAVLQKWGVENKNGRIYPKAILERENERYQKLIEMGASTGECDHPDSAVISIEKVALQVVETWWEGRTLMGKILLPLSRGFINNGHVSTLADKIANDISYGILYGVSSRGIGSVDRQKGKNIVQDDFELICWDWVTTPSTIGAYVYQDKSKTKPHIDLGTTEPNYKVKKETRNFDKMGGKMSSKINSFMKNFKKYQ